MSKHIARFQALEQINAEIDILIDEQRYNAVCKKIHLTSDAESLWNGCFLDPRCTAKTNGDLYWGKVFHLDTFPINKIGRYHFKTPSSATKSANINKNQRLEKSWIVLFWAKRIRSEIQRKNTDCYLRRLDDLVNYLERNLPLEPSELSEVEEIPKEFKLYFYFLMELSAASLDYEQIGYAKRAGRLLGRLPSSLAKQDNFKCFFTMARCWISYANGMAYRHLGQHHKASLEFTDIIVKYQKKRKQYYYKTKWELELKLLYFPSIINLAIIYLQMQLTYGSLQTLARFDKLDEEIMGKVSRFKKIERDLYSIQAFRILELRDRCICELNSVLKRLDFPIKPEISKTEIKIPEMPDSLLREEGSLTRFIELAVNEFMEIVKGVGYKYDADERKFRDWVESNNGQYGHDSTCIIKGIKRVVSVYSALNALWLWVKDNRMDRAGHDRQMAELLLWSIRIIANKSTLDSEDFKKSIGQLKKIVRENAETLFSRIKRPSNNQDSPLCEHCSEKINLFHFRYEDYESFTNDLLYFIAIASDAWPSVLEFKDIYIKDIFIAAIDKREELKGESVHIHRLKLRNKLQLYQNINDCKWCMDDEKLEEKFNKQFKHLLPCRDSKSSIENDRFISDEHDNDKILIDDDYDQIMVQHEDHFNLHLYESTKHAPEEPSIHFIGLQRWNSISPAEGKSLGGGYLLYSTNETGTVELCVAIDPGFDFIRNLFHCGFSLSDIDVILLSHSHLDHIRDFESIVHLLEKIEKRRVNVVLSLGTYDRLRHIFENQKFRRYVEPLIIDLEKDIERENFFTGLGNTDSDNICFSFVPDSGHYKNDLLWRFVPPSEKLSIAIKTLKIWPTRAYHDDHSKISDSFGFIIHFPFGNPDNLFRFGYTGDTKWVTEKFYEALQGRSGCHPIGTGYHPEGIIKQYEKCDLLLVHLGSLINHRKGDRFSRKNESLKLTKEKCHQIVRNENHPYLPGLIGLLNEFSSIVKNGKQRLILLSEFGEELRGTIRTDFVKRLNRVFEQDILPVDVGLDVLCASNGTNDMKERYKFWCVQCRQFHSVKNVDYQHFGTDEALFYFCKSCKKTTSPDRLQDRLRHVYEVGRTLRVSEQKNDKSTSDTDKSCKSLD